MNKISNISSLIPKIQVPSENGAQTTQKKTEVSFEDTMKKFINDVDSAQKYAGESVEKLMTGEIKDIHDVMIAVQKAGTSFELMMEMRNKMIEAYREVMRMQV
ncbi:flagellar hook-basal body complex protein FliE [bacterium]|nr:flagellar hook-basal body complex protein FliE [bacterium]